MNRRPRAGGRLLRRWLPVFVVHAALLAAWGQIGWQMNEELRAAQPPAPADPLDAMAAGSSGS